jgi:subtilisin-like proprotein convertase family protein
MTVGKWRLAVKDLFKNNERKMYFINTWYIHLSGKTSLESITTPTIAR